MSILQILKDDHKLLRKKAKRVNKIDDSIRNLSIDMIETMLSANGIGISGNQVGVLKRIIVILDENHPEVLINPEIIELSQITCVIEEGCLSFPNKFYKIERPEKVKIKYRSIDGHPKIKEYVGLVARCALHEIDHINGIVFLDRK
jgi:peptide deformylase